MSEKFMENLSIVSVFPHTDILHYYDFQAVRKVARNVKPFLSISEVGYISQCKLQNNLLPGIISRLGTFVNISVNETC